MNDQSENPNWLVWGLLGTLALIWGSSYILMKRGLVAFSPVEVAALRMTISGLVLSPFLPAALRQFPKKLFPYLLLVGFVGSGFPAFFYALSIKHTSSALNGIINSLTPLFTLLIGMGFFHVQGTATKIAGVLVGLSGSIVLVLFNASGDFFINAWALLAVAATLCYGTSSNFLKSKLNNIKPLPLTALIYAVVAIPASLFLLFNLNLEELLARPAALPSLGYIALLATFGTAFAIFLFNILIQRTNAVFASQVTYLMPVVAIFWGIVDGEQFGIPQAIGTLLILTGVYLVTRRKRLVLHKPIIQNTDI
jgi:drug/metabolite transporter (DMT)-like permease